MSSKRMLGPSRTSRQEVVQLLALTLQNIMFHTFHIFHMYDGDPSDEIRDLQIRLRLRVRVRVFQCIPGAHARLREAVTSTRSVVKISSPS